MLRDQERPLSAHHNGVREERGAIIIFVALGLVVLIGMLGLAFDLGHAYVNKSQLQNIADASALAGASALNGTAAGITEAEARATDYAGAHTYLANKTEFNTAGVSIPGSAVTYSAALNGPWLANGAAQGTASTIRFVRVVVPPKDTTVFFAKVVPGIPAALNFGAEAVAGEEPLTEVCQGLDPFSPAAIDPNSPTLGYTPGGIYSIRLSPGNSGKNCSVFGLPGSVTGNSGMADPFNFGGNKPGFERSLIQGNGENCISKDGPLPTNTGNMGSNVGKIMSDRFNQDSNTTPYLTYNDYLNSYWGNSANYRRIIRVAFNDGNIPQGNHPYNVAGFGCFFMPVVDNFSVTSDAICLMYVGGCDQSGRPTGGQKPSITKIVLFR